MKPFTRRPSDRELLLKLIAGQEKILATIAEAVSDIEASVSEASSVITEAINELNASGQPALQALADRLETAKGGLDTAVVALKGAETTPPA